jgi:hypothetical protein
LYLNNQFKQTISPKNSPKLITLPSIDHIRYGSLAKKGEYYTAGSNEKMLNRNGGPGADVMILKIFSPKKSAKK